MVFFGCRNIIITLEYVILLNNKKEKNKTKGVCNDCKWQTMKIIPQQQSACKGCARKRCGNLRMGRLGAH